MQTKYEICQKTSNNIENFAHKWFLRFHVSIKYHISKAIDNVNKGHIVIHIESVVITCPHSEIRETLSQARL